MIVLLFSFFYSKGSVKEMLNLSQQDYVKRIEELNQVIMLWTTLSLMQTEPQWLFYWRVDHQHPLLYYTVHVPSFGVVFPLSKCSLTPSLNLYSTSIFPVKFLDQLRICMVYFMLRLVIGKIKSNNLFDVLIYSIS